MDGTETGWGRPAEPAPRWRALLDRARPGTRAAEDSEPETDEQRSAESTAAIRPAPGVAQPRPTRRAFTPLADSRPALEQRPPATVAELGRPLGGGDDVGVEHRGQAGPAFDILLLAQGPRFVLDNIFVDDGY